MFFQVLLRMQCKVNGIISFVAVLFENQGSCYDSWVCTFFNNWSQLWSFLNSVQPRCTVQCLCTLAICSFIWKDKETPLFPCLYFWIKLCGKIPLSIFRYKGISSLLRLLSCRCWREHEYPPQGREDDPEKQGAHTIGISEYPRQQYSLLYPPWQPALGHIARWHRAKDQVQKEGSG